MKIFFYKRWKHRGVILEIQDVWHEPQINILPSWLSLEVSATYPTVPVHLFIHTVKSFTQGEPDVCFPLASFPWKLLGFIASALKAWMVDTTHSISLSNLQKGFPSAESVSQNETYFCAPRKNVWWSRDSNMKTARRALWNRSRFRETARAVKNKRAPDMCLVESGHQNQTRRLAQRFCWLEPAVPPRSLPTLPPTLLPHSSSYLPLSSLFSSPPCFHSSCPVTQFFLTKLFLHSILLSCLSSFHPSTFSLHFPSRSSSTLSFVSCWKTAGDEGVGKAFLFFSVLSSNSCCELWLSTSP